MDNPVEWKGGAVGYVTGAATIALRYRWMIIVAPLLAGFYTGVPAIRQPRTYTASARFLSQSGRVSPTASLASQFGVNLTAGGDPSQTPDFYLELVTSRPVLESTVRSKFSIPPASDSQTLAQAWGGVDEAVPKLRDHISGSVSPKTGIVTFSVRASSAILAQQIVSEMLRQIDYFNQLRRQSRSMAERRFTQAQLVSADSTLRSAENALEDFYQRNREFDRSPDLRFQEQRLTRELSRRQQVSAALAQAYEQAKIDEVRDTPVITVFEAPQLPRISDPRNVVSRVAVSMSIAIVLAFFLGLGLDTLRQARIQATDEFLEVKSLGSRFLSEVRHPLRALRNNGPRARDL